MKLRSLRRYSHRNPASSASPPGRTSLFPAWRSGPTALSPWPSACRCSGCQWQEAWSWYSERSSSPLLVAPLSCSFLFVLRTCSSARIWFVFTTSGYSIYIKLPLSHIYLCYFNLQWKTVTIKFIYKLFV